MSLKEGATLIERIIGIVKGTITPNKEVPAEYMMKEVWDNLASIDTVLTDQMKEPAIVFWRSQVAAERLAPKTLRTYLRYREDDIASEYVPPLPSPPHSPRKTDRPNQPPLRDPALLKRPAPPPQDHTPPQPHP